ncbi:MAG: hypothetical protein Q8Q33_04790 [Chlamydiota bacterium]|nr:hypothetical protein [Chlamydiota bacterium]
MRFEKLNNICYSVCILCVIIGTGFSLYLVWTEKDLGAIAWKTLTTISILFFASAITLAVNKTMSQK